MMYKNVKWFKEHKWIFVGLPYFTKEDVEKLNTWIKDGTFVYCE